MMTLAYASSFFFSLARADSMDIVDYSNSKGSIVTKRIDTSLAFIQKLVESPLLKIEKADLNLVPVDGNCFCYYPNDDSFLELNLLYFGTSYISYMNQFVSSIKGRPLQPISLQLILDTANSPRGNATGDGKIRVWFGEANFDPSVIVHEISHQIHSEMIGKSQEQLNREYGNGLDQKSYAEFVGIVEGTANFLTALYLEDAVIGRIAWVDIPYTIDATFFYDAMPTQYDFLDRIVKSTGFANKYPGTTMRIGAQLPGFAGTETAKLPDPYLSSPLLFQPIWAYRDHYSREGFFLLYLRFLESFTKMTSYTDFAKSFIKFVEPTDKAFADYLRMEYTKRKLTI